MELAGMTMYKTLVMTILALVGVFCYHKKIVDQEMNKKLSELAVHFAYDGLEIDF